MAKNDANKKDSTPQQAGEQRLPMFYKNIVPVNSRAHKDLKFNTKADFSFAKDFNVIPIAVEEFAVAQRFFPILFAPEGEGHPMALLGIKENENRFIDDKGQWKKGTYVPGYVRRYPFILGRQNEESQDFALGVDDTSSRLGTKDGEALFDGDKPSEFTNQVVKFCEDYERAAHNTRLFCNILNEHSLLRSGEVNLVVDGKPIKYGGFRMIDEQKINTLSDDVLATLVKNGALTAMHAHLFSLSALQGLFEVNPDEVK